MHLCNAVYKRHGKSFNFWVAGECLSRSLYAVFNRNRLKWVSQHITVISMCYFCLSKNLQIYCISPLTASMKLILFW